MLGPYLKIEKCEFHKEMVRYLGLIISTKRISIAPDKVETVWNWSWEVIAANGWLNNLFKVQQFLGLFNFY